MSEQTSPQNRAITPRRRLLAYLATAMLVAVAGFALTRQALHQGESPAPERSSPETPTRQDPLAEAAAVHEGPGAQSTAAAQSRPAAPRAPARAYPEDLVIELSQFARHGLAREDGAAITGILNALAAQGEAAIPAISEFLEGGEDVGFARVRGLNADSSLRLALFDVLRRIGGAQAEAVLLGELQATAEPLEISTLAQFLEEQAPGEYAQQAVAAARETLKLSLASQSAPGDVGPLFQVLHDYGGAAVVPELQRHAEKWGHYTTIALGELSGGEGIPVLVERVERRLERRADTPANSSAIYGDEDLFALQMLAQVAVDQPQAQAALLEQAAAGRIPDALWPKLTQALAGAYLFQTTRRGAENVSGVESESRTYPHVRVGNAQVLYIQNRFEANDLSAEQRLERVAMIDEVLSVSKSAQARAALERARASLLKGQW